MEKQPETTPIKSLRDAYKVRGFRVLATLDSYELDPPVLVLTFSRRAKKRCAAAVGKFAAALTTAAGVRMLSQMRGSAWLISTSKRAAWVWKACGVKNEKLAFLSSNTKYTLRFAMQIVVCAA